MAYRALEPATAASPPPRDLLAGADMAALTRRSDARGASQLAGHAACIAATATLVGVAMPLGWVFLLPAMLLHGVTLVTLFAPMHECVHRTAFASRGANLAVAWVAGTLAFYNSTFYRHFHAWHHRYTQDPARDPELLYPKAANRLAWLREVSGANFWWRRFLDYPRLAMGRLRGLPFLPERERGAVARSMTAQLLVYAAAAGAAMLGVTGVFYFWFLPVVLAQPVLRAMLIVEHTGCSEDANGLANTRTTLASLPLRLLMWNMPFHAEHHLFPAVPFHRLPAVHRHVVPHLAHVAPGYAAANRDVLRSL